MLSTMEITVIILFGTLGVLMVFASRPLRSSR